MSNKNELYQIKFPWTDKKFHTVQLVNSSGKLDINNLIDTAIQTLKDKEEICKKIYYLALGITRNPRLADGFVMGWIVKSLKDATEKSSNDKLEIVHEVEEIDPKEFRQRAADELRDLADKIQNSEDDVSIPLVREDDGSKLFE